MESVSLRPTTSRASRRYDRSHRVEVNHISINAGPFAASNDLPEPPYLAQSWISCVHPEGQRYFLRTQNPRMVTEAYMFRPEIMDQILLCAKYVEDLLHRRNQSLTDNMEIFLDIDDSANSFAYYIVDHASRREFWLEEVSTEDLGLPAVASPAHFDLCSEELYWNHVEYFPVHIQLPSRAIDELVTVLGHGRVDRMTSTCSTFPYTADECARFTETLQCSRRTFDDVVDGATACAAARLWGVVINHRFIAFAGQEQCRLSRDQSIVAPANDRKHCLFLTSSRLSFGVADTYLDQLDNLYVDEILYNDQWQSFLPKCIDDWKTTVFWAFGSLLSCLLLSSSPSASAQLGLSSVLLSGASILSACFLLITHQRLVDVTTAEAAMYLQDALSEKYGFLARASLFALPRVFFLWGFGLCMAQAVFMSARLANPYIEVCAVVGVVCAVFVSKLRSRKRTELACEHTAGKEQNADAMV